MAKLEKTNEENKKIVKEVPENLVSLYLNMGWKKVQSKDISRFKGMVENKKRTEEEKLRYSRAMGVFVGVLALAELILALFPNNSLVLMINIGIVVVDLIAIGTFTKKHT